MGRVMPSREGKGCGSRTQTYTHTQHIQTLIQTLSLSASYQSSLMKSVFRAGSVTPSRRDSGRRRRGATEGGGRGENREGGYGLFERGEAESDGTRRRAGSVNTAQRRV